jgi:hypothetical protein
MALIERTGVRNNTSDFNTAIQIQNSLGVVNGKFCRAFHFTRPGGITLFNVSSVIDFGGGNIQISFTNTMPNDRYTTIVSANHSRGIGDGNRIFFHVRDRQAGYVRLETIGGNGETGTYYALDLACIIF